MESVFENRQTAQDLARTQHLTPHGANHGLKADPPRMHVIIFGSGPFAQTDRHHLIQPAFNLPGKIGVLFDAAHQKDAGSARSMAI